MNFFIVDNRLTHLASLQQLLTAAFPDSKLWPSDAQTISNWQTAAEELQANTTNDEDLVVVLDLGVEAEDMASLHSGVEQAYALRSLRPRAVFISYTQWHDRAEVQPHYSETFDGGIDKQRLTGYETSDEQQSYVQRIVRSAMRDRFGTKAVYTLKDSFGLRLAVAAFGEAAFDFLVDDVADSWRDIEVAALTSGHSGAFILRVSGTLQGAPQRLIVKCARNAQLISAETSRVNKYLAELGPLAEVLAPFEQQPRELPHESGYYYRQAEIRGEPLLGVLAERGWNEETQRMLEAVVSLELRCYRRRQEEQFAQLPASEVFTLSPIDKGRAYESLDMLADIGAAVIDAGVWPDIVPASEMAATISTMIGRWDNLLLNFAELYGVAQHGDLNPGNILIPAAGNVVLIDFSRVGRWPVGYDLARLAAMLRIRLTDSAKHRDWAENRIGPWAMQAFPNIHGGPDRGDGGCASADYCDQQFVEFVAGCPPEQQTRLISGHELGTLWDLVKVLSYSDLAPFKRLWALIACYRLALKLRLTEPQ